MDISPPCSPQICFPLSSVQREMWFQQALYPNTPVLNIGGYARIIGYLDPQVFCQANILLVEETAVLRLRLTELDGIAQQSFPLVHPIDVGFYDCSNEADPMQSALSSMQETVSRPFQILAEPLFRFNLYKIADNCHLWLQTFHHLVADGFATALITQRLAARYSALGRGEPNPPPTRVPDSDFVDSDIAYLESTQFERHRHYWKQKFSTLPEPMLLPISNQSKQLDVVPGGTLTRILPRSQYARLEALAQAHSVSVFHVFLGLLYVYFTRTCDRDECVIGLPVLNRNTPAFKQTIGLFASMIPARFELGRETDFVGLIQSIARTLRESYRYQRFPVSEINRLAGVLESGRKRLFDISLSFESANHRACFGDCNVAEALGLTHGFEQLPLAVFVREYSEAQDLQVDFAYNLAYFDVLAIERVMTRFMHLLDAVLTYPTRAIGELDILPKQERQQLLVGWNQTEAPIPQACVHRLFEQQVAKTPQATAVVFEEQRLSYAELNARANQLAHWLRAQHVGADHR
ncbi:MAG: condensation domain-containing protein, partial [Burkholderiales bacterium]